MVYRIIQIKLIVNSRAWQRAFTYSKYSVTDSIIYKQKYSLSLSTYIIILFELLNDFHDRLVGPGHYSQHGHRQDNDVLDVRPHAQSLGHLGPDHEIDQHWNDKGQASGAQGAD